MEKSRKFFIPCVLFFFLVLIGADAAAFLSTKYISLRNLKGTAVPDERPGPLTWGRYRQADRNHDGRVDVHEHQKWVRAWKKKQAKKRKTSYQGDIARPRVQPSANRSYSTPQFGIK